MDSEFGFNRLSLSAVLNGKTVVELRDAFYALGYKVVSGVRKAQIVSELAKTMLEQPELVIKAAFCYELRFWLRVLEGKVTYRETESSGMLFDFNRFGFLYAIKGDDEHFYFQKDMADRLRPLIPSEIERRENDASEMVEQVAFGCANIYGFTDINYIMSYLPLIEERFGRPLTHNEVQKVFYPLARFLKFGVSKTLIPLMSPFAQWVGFDIKDVDFKVDAKVYDLDTMLNMGMMPYPVFPEVLTAPLREALSRYGKKDRDSDEEIFRDLWLFKQDLHKSNQIPDLNRYFTFTSTDDIQGCLNVLMGFLNGVPFWKLHGNTSEEMGRKEMAEMAARGEMPRIVMGPNMRARGIDSWEQLVEMHRRGEDIPPMPSGFSRKVGRNDPCPCGSGKKYKNCCGK